MNAGKLIHPLQELGNVRHVLEMIDGALNEHLAELKAAEKRVSTGGDLEDGFIREINRRLGTLETRIGEAVPETHAAMLKGLDELGKIANLEPVEADVAELEGALRALHRAQYHLSAIDAEYVPRWNEICARAIAILKKRGA